VFVEPLKIHVSPSEQPGGDEGTDGVVDGNEEAKVPQHEPDVVPKQLQILLQDPARNAFDDI